ncbi:hypothetical protein LSAT2_005742 [Lamellibrachia satsuma]|nr:hypothetical protein LSAT2_005742 [Lamellibrachia satsuma]
MSSNESPRMYAQDLASLLHNDDHEEWLPSRVAAVTAGWLSWSEKGDITPFPIYENCRLLPQKECTTKVVCTCRGFLAAKMQCIRCKLSCHRKCLICDTCSDGQSWCSKSDRKYREDAMTNTNMFVVWNIVIFASFVQLATTLSTKFPANWQSDNARWFSEYDAGGNVWTYTFNDEGITMKPEGAGPTPPIRYTCVDSVENDPYFYYVRKIGSSFECVQTASAIGAILQRTKTIGEHRCQMLPLFTTYSESAGDVKCNGDDASVTDVARNTLELNTCFSGATSYAKPLKTTLTILAHVTGSILDSEDNGDILLLGDFTATPNRFYCARYTIDGTTIKLSLDISDENAAKCTKSQTSTSAEAGKFVAFVLTEKMVAHTTKTRKTITTPTTAIKPKAATTTTTTTTAIKPKATTTKSTTAMKPKATTTTMTTTTNAAEKESTCSCQHGGQCVTVCSCIKGYTGNHCEVIVDKSTTDSSSNSNSNSNSSNNNKDTTILFILAVMSVVLVIIIAVVWRQIIILLPG